jgi:hypothetical protein
VTFFFKKVPILDLMGKDVTHTCHKFIPRVSSAETAKGWSNGASYPFFEWEENRIRTMKTTPSTLTWGFFPNDLTKYHLGAQTSWSIATAWMDCLRQMAKLVDGQVLNFACPRVGSALSSKQLVSVLPTSTKWTTE